MKLTELLVPLVLVTAGIGLYHLAVGQPEAPTPIRTDDQDGKVDTRADTAASTPPSFELTPRPQPRASDMSRLAGLEQAVADLRGELARTRADLLALEVMRGREQSASTDPNGRADSGVGQADFSTLELDRYEALVAASRTRREARNFARAIAARLPKLPINLTAEQQRQLLDLTLEFRARSSAATSEAEREGLRRDMDRQLGGIVQGRDAQIVSELLVQAAVRPQLPATGSANINNR